MKLRHCLLLLIIVPLFAGDWISILSQGVSSAISNITVDNWQSFEGAALDTDAHLDAGATGGGGAWHNGTVTQMSISTSAQMKMLSTVNGVTDAGTVGLAWANTSSQADYVYFTPTTGWGAGPVVYGFWFYVPTVTSYSAFQPGGFYNVQMIRLYNNAGNYEIDLGTTSGNIPVTVHTWIWLTLYAQKNATCTLTGYSSTGALIGSVTATGANVNFGNLLVGSANVANLNDTMYFDNICIKWSATVPTTFGP